MAYADPHLAFYAFALFAMLLGDAVAGVMVGSAVFAAATAVAVYLLFRYIFKSELPAIAASVVSAVSAERIGLVTNVMKNSLGILFVVGVVFFLQRCLDPSKRTRSNFLGAIGFFLLTMMTHVLDQGIALLFVGCYLVAGLFLAERKRLLVAYGSIFLSAVAGTVAGFLLLPWYFGDFAKGLAFVGDLAGSSTSASSAGASGRVGIGPPPVRILDRWRASRRP